MSNKFDASGDQAEDWLLINSCAQDAAHGRVGARMIACEVVQEGIMQGIASNITGQQRNNPTMFTTWTRGAAVWISTGLIYGVCEAGFTNSSLRPRATSLGVSAGSLVQ